MTSQKDTLKYKVIFPYTSEEDGCLNVIAGDILEVEEINKDEPGWTYGKCERLKKEGYVPTTFLTLLSKKPQPLVPSRTKIPVHNFTDVFFKKPALCSKCKDFIWGQNVVGKQCLVCKMVFHLSCTLILTTDKKCTGSVSTSEAIIDTFSSPVLVTSWCVQNVLDWMAVTNISRYLLHFKNFNIDGSKLVLLDDFKLQEINIKDPFHRISILEAINQLVCDKDATQIPSDKLTPHNDHYLLTHTFSEITNCKLCLLPMCGIQIQGLQCQNCLFYCHRRCSIFNLSPCTEDNSFIKDSLFGTPLTAYIDIPPFVVKFIEELEGRNNTTGLIVIDAYRDSPQTSEIALLKASLNADLSNTNLNKYSNSYIAATIKQYFKDLPTSLVPEENYFDFIAKLDLENMSTDEIIGSLPNPHPATLRYLLVHLANSIQVAVNSGKKNEDILNKLSHVFGPIVFRPPWPDVIEVTVEDKLKAFHFILSETVKSVASAQNSRSVASLEDQPWYWGDAERTEINESMSNSSDGSFLVRKSSSNNDFEPYTICLRMQGKNKLIHIYQEDNKFGLMMPFMYNSVVDLINHFQAYSLAEFNRDLDIKLSIPLTKTSSLSRLSETIDIETLKLNFVNNFKKINEYNERLGDSRNSLYAIEEDLKTTLKAFSALKMTMQMYEEQLNFLKTQETVKSQDIARSLILRIDLLRGNFQKLSQFITTMTKEKDKFNNECDQIQMDLEAFYNIQDISTRKLYALGETSETLYRIANLTSNNQENNSSIKVDSRIYKDERTWFVNCDRGLAIQILTGKPLGTFLIRNSSAPGINQYALSIVSRPMKKSEIEIFHCMIERKEHGYGFSDPFYIYETLTDLVEHYRDNSLLEHNENLNVCLEFPINAHLFSEPPAVKLPTPAPRNLPIPPRSRGNIR